MRPAFFLATIIVLLTLILLSTAINVTPSTAAFGSTPSTTPAPNLQLPDWVHDRSVNIFIARTYTEEDDFPVFATLINVDTAERFVLDWPYIYEADWYVADGKIFLRLWRYQSSGADNSDGFVEFVDISTGQLTRYSLDDDNRPDRRNALPEPSTDNGDGVRYVVSDDNQVSLVSEAGVIPLDNPVATLGYHYSTLTWHGDYLHVRYWDYDDTGHLIVGEDVIYNTAGETIMTFEGASSPIWANRERPLALYRTESGKTCLINFDLREPTCDLFSGWQTDNLSQVINVFWSPSNNDILFFYRFGDSERGGLCRYTLADGAINCIWERNLAYPPFSAFASRWLDNSTLVFSFHTPQEEWDTRNPRDSGLCILHLDTDEVYCPTDDVLPADTYYTFNVVSPSRAKIALSYTGQFYEGQDGVCIHDLQTRQTACPVTAEDLDGWFVEEIGWSSDSRQVVVMYGPYGPLSDDKSFTRFGFVDVATDTYRDEGYAYLEHDHPSLWRP